MTLRRRVVLLALLAALPIFGVHAEERIVTLLHTNDIESVYEPVEAFWNPEIERIGGMPHLATLIRQVREREGVSFLFDAGDIFTGALSQHTEGRLPFDLYSAMGYDAVNVGNHEFEYGWQVLRRVSQRARYPFLCANLFYEGTDIPYAQAYTILEREGVRVGVIGAMGVDAFVNTIGLQHRTGLEVREVAPSVQTHVDEIRDEVDLVVVLTHQNRTSPMQTDKEADPEVQRGFDEDYALAGVLRGVDVILGGHSDNGLWEPVRHPDTGTLIGMTFGQGKQLGSMRLAVDRDAGTVELLEGGLIPVQAEKLEPAADVLELIAAARSTAPQLTEVVGRVESTAIRRYYRESSLGNLLADILRRASRADIAVMNSGSLRADLNPGSVTVEEILNIYPFIGKFHVVEISGEGVRELLEHSYALVYGYAQMSGVGATYDSRRPVGSRLVEAKINGAALDPAAKYTVAASAFLALGGDDYSMLAAGRPVRTSADKLSRSFIDHFRDTGLVEVPTIGRQTDLARGSAPATD